MMRLQSMKTVLLQPEEVWNTITIIEMRQVILLVKSLSRGLKELIGIGQVTII